MLIFRYCFYRQPEMKNDTVTLGLKLVANDHFSLTFKEFDKMEGFTSGVLCLNNSTLQCIKS